MDEFYERRVGAAIVKTNEYMKSDGRITRYMQLDFQGLGSRLGLPIS